MPNRDPLATLHAEYAAHARSRQTTLGYDHRVGLRYYLSEIYRSTGQGVPPDIGQRVVEWTINRELLEQFQTVYGRMPRENRRLPREGISADERRLAEWVRTRRTAHAEGRLCSYQVRRLECIPGFDWAPKENRWWGRYDDYAAYVNKHGTLPSERDADERVRSLARWATSQRAVLRAGRLAGDRLNALDAIRSWRRS